MKSFKKLFLSGLLTMMCGMLLLTSCSKSSDLASYIPNDAFVVANVDMNTLWDRIDVDNIDNIAFVKLARQELRSENPKLAELIDNIIKDPQSTGLNLKSEVAVYASPTSNANMLFVMHKASKFEKFLEEYAKSENTTISIDKEDDYKVVSLEGKKVLAFNSDVALVCFNFDNPEFKMNVMKKYSLAKNKNYKEYWKNHGEVSVWVNFGEIYRMAKMFGGDELFAKTGMPQEMIDAFKEGSVSLNLIFDKGVMRFVGETQGIDAKVLEAYMQKFNDDLVKYMPEKSYMAFSYAYNMEMLVKMLENMKDDIDLNEKVVGNKTVKDVIQCFNGSIVASIFDWVANKETSVMPMLAIAADIKDAATLKQIIAEAGLTQKDGLYMVPDFGMGVEVYVALTDKVLYLTNSEAAAKQFLAGGYSNSMKDISKKIKEGNYIYADLNINRYPEVVVKLIPASIVKLLSGYFDYAEALVTGKTSGEWDFYLADKKENSLLYTLHFIDQHLMDLGNLADMLPKAYTSFPEVDEIQQEGADTVIF